MDDARINYSLNCRFCKKITKKKYKKFSNENFTVHAFLLLLYQTLNLGIIDINIQLTAEYQMLQIVKRILFLFYNNNIDNNNE